MVSRREFIKTSSAVAAGAALGSNSVLAQKPKPVVAVAKGTPAESVKKAVSALGGIQTFVKQGDRVVIKPNMGFPNPPEWSTTTHPEVVKTVVELCFEAGASRVIVVDHPLRDAQICKERNGIGAAVEGIKGAVVAMLDDKKFYVNKINDTAVELKTTDVMKEVERANCLINVPTAKSHSATGVSLGIKNLMGLVWDRTVFHEKLELNRAMAELLFYIKPTLTIVDCINALVTRGPSGPGKTVDLNTVVATTDPVAADSYTVGIARWYDREFKGDQVKHIKYAYEMGFGEIDVAKMDVKIV
jgi:uncharacterized protein (DUF362 family)